MRNILSDFMRIYSKEDINKIFLGIAIGFLILSFAVYYLGYASLSDVLAIIGAYMFGYIKGKNS